MKDQKVNTTTKRFPRTTHQAFGPYGWPRTGHEALYGPHRRQGNGRIRSVLLALAIGIALGAVLARGI